MRSDWELVAFETLLSNEKRSLVSGPFGSNIGRKFFVEYGIPVIRGNNLSINVEPKYIDSGYVYVTESKANSLSSHVARKGDILFTAAGTIGQVGLIPDNARYKLTFRTLESKNLIL